MDAKGETGAGDRIRARYLPVDRDHVPDEGLVLVGELRRHDAERGVEAAVRRLDAPVQIDSPVDEPGHGPVRRRRPVRVLHPPVEDVVDEVEQELDGGAKRGQRAGEREEEGLQEEVEEDGEPAAEAADLGAGEAVDGPVPADLGRAEEVQELHRAGPVRPQHHVVIAEAVVELAHAGRRPLRLNCTLLHTLAVTV